MHLNIGSIAAHFDEFYCFVQDYINLLDIIILSEVHLREEQYINIQGAFQLQSFNSIHKLRVSRSGGGLLVYVRNAYRYEIFNADLNFCESLNLKLQVGCKQFYVLALYRPPDFSVRNYLEELESLLSIERGKPFVVVGDVNINLLDDGLPIQKYKDILMGESFDSLVKVNTHEAFREGNIMSSIIDHIFYKGMEPLFVIQTKISDHYIVGCAIQINKQSNEPNWYDTVIRKCDEHKLKYLLNNALRPDIVHQFNDANELFNYISLSYNALGQSTRKFKRGRKPKKPWLTQEVLDNMSLRDKAFSAWKNYLFDGDVKQSLRNM